MDEEMETESGVESLMLISEMMPSFMFELNCRKIEAKK
jgi:hypothetical protein